MSSKNILILVLVILCVVKISKTSQINLNDYPDFEEFGTYSEEKVGENLTKNYVGKQASTVKKVFLISKEEEGWVKAAANCHKAGLEFATLETKEESEFLGKILENKTRSDLDIWIHVGGLTKLGGTRKDWVWLETGKPIEYELNFFPGEPNLPSIENCLAVGVQLGNKFHYYDIQCSTWEHKYICQKKLT